MITKDRLNFWQRLRNFLFKRSHFYLIFIFTLITVLNFPALAKKETLTSTQQVNYFYSLIGQKATAATQPANPQELISQGRNFYKAGKFADAVNIWQQAVNAGDTQGDILSKAMALNLVSLAHQELGQWQQATETINASLQIFKDAGNLKNQQSAPIFAQTLSTQGHLQFLRGQAEAALSSWEQANQIYKQLDDQEGMIGSWLNQAQALQVLGLYQRELDTLAQVTTVLDKQPNSLIKADTLRAFGDTLRRVGELERSQQILQQSLELAQQLQSPKAMGESLLALGNSAHAAQNNKAALEFYAQVPNINASNITKIQAQINQLSLLIEELRLVPARELWQKIQPQLQQLPPSRTSIYAQINFAESLKELKNITSKGVAEWSDIAKILANAVHQAKDLADGRAEAYAVGELGGLYEATNQLSAAQNLTQQALLKAQALNAPDIAYRWQWQLGRILKAEGNNKDAIAFLTEAVNNLQLLRTDLASINRNLQFSFRKSVQPVYRELIGLLLQDTADNNQQTVNQQSVDTSRAKSLENKVANTQTSDTNRLAQALQVLELLQLAELDNFFGDTCSDAASNSRIVEINKIDPTAAVIYPIISANRLDVVLSLPGQPLRHYFTTVSQRKVEDSVAQLRRMMTSFTGSNLSSTSTFLSVSQQIYDWLIRPMEKELASNQVKTLVFVPDGSLRNIPMSVLHDRKQYLVQKYAIALSPRQQLPETKPLTSKQLKVFMGGISETRQGFSSLPGVAQELKQIQEEVPAVVLLNQKFTTQSIQQELQSAAFPIVHLATHGNFSSQAENTFILTWDGRLNIKQIEKLLKSRETNGSNAIELIVFSACQTAQGDEQAALGLAGMAVRSGANSTLASLWSVSDEATSVLMSDFYSYLAKTKNNKATALRLAQLDLLKQPQFQHPLFWAPYVLVGNWL